jgi:predicted O-methyltransferase YrrM
MRSFSHWTPAYIYHRLADWSYRSSHPTNPWLTPKAVEFLEQTMAPDFFGLEYGSGRSTTWFARHIQKLISVEHNPDWFARVNAEIEAQGLTNIEYHHFAKPDPVLPLAELIKTNYVQADPALKVGILDFALIDGIVRPACVLRAIPLLKSGGLLIIDDANHYLPCDSLAPNTRTAKDGPLNNEWVMVQKALQEWDTTWFGNGIKETVVYRKPNG